MKLEKARINDVTQIHELVNYFANRDEMLPRSLSEIYENIRDYFVVRQENRVVACVALHTFDRGLVLLLGDVLVLLCVAPDATVGRCGVVINLV